MTDPKNTRRDFLGASAATVAGAAAVSFVPNAHAAGQETLKVGVIGCGGRGTGAAENICEAASIANKSIKLYALADVFEDKVKGCAQRLENNPKCQGMLDLDPERLFVGFDAFQKVIDSCDLVILATPPGFRPQHVQAAVKAGRHVFCEKPVAVDGTGIRKVLDAAEQATSSGLAIVTGTQRRHQKGYIESLEKIHNGDLGDVITARVFWNQGNIWVRPRKPGMDDMAYQLHNWYHFLWLCGDHIVEQHVHNLDVARWALGDAVPASCVGMGGQQVNRDPGYGESYDHFAVDYAFPDGQHVLSMCRQIDGCAKDVSESIVGAKGEAHLRPGNYTFRGEGNQRLRVRDERNPYVQEHIDLLNSIADGNPLNELERVAHSTLMAIMGRMSAYTGKEVSWDQALNSKLDTFPEKLEWGPRPEPVVAMPGITELI